MLRTRCDRGASMTHRSPVYCESAELAVEAAALASGLGLSIETELNAQTLDAAARAASRGQIAVALCTHFPEPSALVQALDTCSAAERVVIAAVGERDEHTRGLAADLGFACVRDVAPALA